MNQSSAARDEAGGVADVPGSPRTRRRPLLGAVSSRFRLRRCQAVGDTPNVSGSVWVKGAGCVRVGHRVSIDGREAPVELYAHAGAELRVGDDVRIGPGASLVAAGLVVVGDRVELGPFCKTLDCHYHPLQGDRNRPPRPMRVVIEHDAVIGKGAILLPGAHVKAGASVGAHENPRRSEQAGDQAFGFRPCGFFSSASLAR